MKRIKLLVEWEGYPPGTLLDVNDEAVEALIAAQTAAPYDAEAIKQAQTEADASATAETDRIRQIVDDALAGLKASNVSVPPRVQVISEPLDRDAKKGFNTFADFMGVVHKHNIGRLTDNRLAKYLSGSVQEKAITGLGELVDSDGGVLVPPEFRAELLQKTYETALVANRCRRLPVSVNALRINYIAESSRADGSRSGGIRGYWGAEAGTMTPSAASFGQLQLTLNKLYAVIYATDELLSDSIVTLNEMVNTMVAQELAVVLDEAIINGTGAGQPLGIVAGPSTISVAKETGQLAATIVSENILNMFRRLYARSRNSAVWFVAQDTMGQLYQMSLPVGTGGGLTFMPPGGLSGKPYATLMGLPISEIEQCQTLGTVGDIILADMSQYLLAEHSLGMLSATSIHLRFLQGEQIFRFSIRVDGQPWWKSALTPMHGSVTVSPFVTLATRA